MMSLTHPRLASVADRERPRWRLTHVQRAIARSVLGPGAVAVVVLTGLSLLLGLVELLRIVVS
jgi:hypothetical protein